MKNRLALAQLALFLVIGVACSFYVLSNVLGPRAITGGLTVTVRMPDTGGSPRSPRSPTAASALAR